MSILFTNEITDAIIHEFRTASESVQIITAYCKENSLKNLSDHISSNIRTKKIMLRFRLDDLLKGSTDFSVIDYCRDNGWKVYVRFDLHAKTYIVDNKRGFVGSANATNSGLNLGRNANIEMGTLVDIEESDIEKINNLYRDAILVDNHIYELLKEQYQNIEQADIEKGVAWNNDITSLFCPHVDSLFSYELPEQDLLTEGDYISFLDLINDGNIENMKEQFRWSNAYVWLKSILEKHNGEIYYGQLSSELHNALVTDPKPYRRDVKIYLSNLLSIVEQLDIDEIKIDRPNYSQRITLL